MSKPELVNLSQNDCPINANSIERLMDFILVGIGGCGTANLIDLI